MPAVTPFSRLLRDEAPFPVGDGAMATMLQRAGLPLEGCAERWNLEQPQRVAAVHRAYAAAGAAWVQTNTFGANRVRLARAGLEHRVEEINGEAVRIARRAAPGLPVVGSVGPTGSREPRDWSAFESQLHALAAAGVDGFLVETIVSAEEGTAAVRAAAAAGAGPVLASFTPDRHGRLLDGSEPERAAEAWVKAGAAVVGVNCGGGPETLFAPARRLAAAELAPVLAAPNAGLPTIQAGAACYDLQPDGFARAAIQFREIGVCLVAGCCGTTPEHISAALHALRRPA